MIRNSKSTLEQRISKLESLLKAESVDFGALSKSLWDSQDEITSAASKLNSKFRRYVIGRPGVGHLEYSIPEDAFESLTDAVGKLGEALEDIKKARRILDGYED